MSQPSPTIPYKPTSAYTDHRGTIMNLLELGSKDAPIRGVSFISTRAGEYRSNHHHKTDGHWLFVMSGAMHYTECPAEGDKPPEYPPYIEVKEGEMVWTGPGVWHKTFFPTDTVLLSLSLRPRDHASHEADLVRAP